MHPERKRPAMATPGAHAGFRNSFNDPVSTASASRREAPPRGVNIGADRFGIRYPLAAKPERIVTDGKRFQLCSDKLLGLDALVYPELGYGFEIVERVAWRPSRPELWWVERENLPLIGERFLDLAALRREPAFLVETPADFVATDPARNPICILAWHCDPRFAIREVARVVCASERLARWLHQQIQKCAAPNFSIEVCRHAR